MSMDAQEFLRSTGLEKDLRPGQIETIRHVGEKEGNSYTMIYDWKSDPNKIRVEVLPGLSGKMPPKSELKKYALWLQTPTYLEVDVAMKKAKSTN